MKKTLLSLLISLLAYYDLSAIRVIDATPPASFLKETIENSLKQSGKVRLDLFVMSMCPYGINAERSIVPILREMGDKIDFNLYFIAGEQAGGVFQSLHGSPEILEDRRQLVISRHFPSHFLNYLSLRLSDYSDPDWTLAARSVGLDVNLVTALVNSGKEIEAFRSNIALGNIRMVEASPSLFINGSYFKGSFVAVSQQDVDMECQGGSKPAQTKCSGPIDCPNACEHGSNPGASCTSAPNSTDCHYACENGSSVGNQCAGIGDDITCHPACVGGSNPGADCINEPLKCHDGGTCSNMGTCTNKGTCTNIGKCVPLPVELIDFGGSILVTHQIQLTWETATEDNNRGFEIQHSSDGQTWDVKAFVNGHGTSNTVQQYEWIDKSPSPGISYYRLKQIDYDDNFKFSKTIVIRMDSSTGFAVQAFPNPVTRSTNLLVTSDVNGEISACLFNASGQKVFSNNFAVTKGDNVFLLDLTKFAAGGFSLVIEQEGIVKAGTRILLIK